MGQFDLKILRRFMTCSYFAPVLLAVAVTACGQLQDKDTNNQSQIAENRYDIMWFTHENDPRAAWGTFGGDAGDLHKFQEYVQRSHPGSQPPAFNDKLVLNCWEFILYGAWRGGRITAQDIQRIYADALRTPRCAI